MNMRNATCMGTQTSKVPTRVTLLFIPYTVAWGKSCRSCGVRNHFANVCRKAQKTDFHAMNELDSENTDDDGDYVECDTV